MPSSSDFFTAVRASVQGGPGDAAPFLTRPQTAARVSVYRNNRAVALADALSRSFPAVLTLVGDRFMRAMSIEYARQHPPRDPVLALYGADFADFLQDFPPLEKLAYLADIARLDRAWTEASFASDGGLGAPLPADDEPLRLSPRTRLLFLDWPAHALWQSSRAGLSPPADQLEPAREAVLVWRGPEGMASQVLEPSFAARPRGALPGPLPAADRVSELVRRGALIACQDGGPA